MFVVSEPTKLHSVSNYSFEAVGTSLLRINPTRQKRISYCPYTSLVKRVTDTYTYKGQLNFFFFFLFFCRSFCTHLTQIGRQKEGIYNLFIHLSKQVFVESVYYISKVKSLNRFPFINDTNTYYYKDELTMGDVVW